MKVVGYTYDAAMHCPDCTKKYIIEHFPETEKIIDSIMGGWIESSDYDIVDSENNAIHPAFDTDDAGDTPDHCDDCGAFIDTSWHGETVNYAIAALGDYVIDAMQGIKARTQQETLDTWNEHLQWCGVDVQDKLVMDLYTVTRQKEVEYELSSN